MNTQELDIFLRKYTPQEEMKTSIPDDFYTASIPFSESDVLTPFEKKEKIHDLLRTKSTADQAIILNMLNMIQNTDGIIVAKQDRFSDVPLHRHDWFELAYMYSGSCTITLGDNSLTAENRTITLTRGQTLLIDRNTPHSCLACGEDDILINLLIRKNDLDTNFFNRFSNESYLSQFLINALNNQTAEDSFLYFHSENSRRLPIFMTEFLCEFYDKSMNSNDFLDSYITLIFLELAEVFKDDLHQKNIGHYSRQIFSILHYIEKNAMTCTLKSTADAFHMNPNYLSNYIKKHTGRTYKELIQNQRLQAAATLLSNTTLPVTEVSQQCGYENVSFFYKKFSERFHCSPGEFRRRF